MESINPYIILMAIVSIFIGFFIGILTLIFKVIMPVIKKTGRQKQIYLSLLFFLLMILGAVYINQGIKNKVVYDLKAELKITYPELNKIDVYYGSNGMRCYIRFFFACEKGKINEESFFINVLEKFEDREVLKYFIKDNKFLSIDIRVVHKDKSNAGFESKQYLSETWIDDLESTVWLNTQTNKQYKYSDYVQ